ncbi:hypothetical protein KVF89_20880 [Nocardioides carbamazepini]|uniref:PEP/pyruvate-binding domain-containing protein n=1 Tax=Nocardioides carbamazepini TaxID=2854259 RepID=UPI002149F7A6|nr:PEP/pyruvate-binding domain-containing protein [Nocardioides carbamazepini]MCR1785007.1 hypothetical protein [Nocardioides carbamazepini]
MTLHRHAYFRLKTAGTTTRDVPGRIVIYGERSLLAIVECPDRSGPELVVEAADWADDSDTDARARFLLGTKAQTLARLHGRLHSARTLEQLTVTRDAWSDGPDQVLDEVAAMFATEKIIVRSSAASEDSWHASQAGRYKSIYGIVPTDRDRLLAAFDEVWESYGEPHPADEVLVQPALEDVEAAGVVTTREMRTKAPYYVVVGDDSTGRTDTVTAGVGVDRMFYVARDAPAALTDARLPVWVRAAIALAHELEDVIGSTELDIEFAMTRDGELVLLQVRRLTGDADAREADHAYAVGVHAVKSEFRVLAGTRRLGEGIHLSGMSDWNPAEMIGLRPRPLARSLYEYLITDEVWSQSRARLGYRDVGSVPLMRNVGGYAFIDVRASFSSFVPASVSDGTAQALVSHYLAKLDRSPHLHDKIEFDIATTCLDFGWPTAASEFSAAGLTASQAAELEAGLRQVTLAALNVPQRASEYFARSRQLHVGTSPLDDATARLGFIRAEGTPAFADAARAGFVAASFVRSLQATGLTTAEHVEAFMTSLSTVSDELIFDGQRVQRGTMSWKDFVATYQHLRPGTYDIESPVYGDDPELFLGPFVKWSGEPADDRIEQRSPAEKRWPPRRPWPLENDRAVARALSRAKLPVDTQQLATFIREAAELREKVKFDFTRHLSAALESIANHYAQTSGLPRPVLSYLRLGDLWHGGYEWATDAAHLRNLSDRRAAHFGLMSAVRLPEYLSAPSQLEWFEASSAVPNFIGSGRVKAPVRVVARGEMSDLSGKIVAIEAADPGFDWIFGYPIAGMITRYGGANSHMAIRAAELAIPAAIGVGTQLFELLTKASIADLDCGARRLMPG